MEVAFRQHPAPAEVAFWHHWDVGPAGRKAILRLFLPGFLDSEGRSPRAGTSLANLQDATLFVLENLYVLRACLIVLAVAVLSAWMVQLRDAQGDGTAQTRKIAWVRTVDGWEPSSVLTLGPPPAGPPVLHPGLVATLQLGVSLFALIALPAATKIARPKS